MRIPVALTALLLLLALPAAAQDKPTLEERLTGAAAELKITCPAVERMQPLTRYGVGAVLAIGKNLTVRPHALVIKASAAHKPREVDAKTAASTLRIQVFPDALQIGKVRQADFRRTKLSVARHLHLAAAHGGLIHLKTDDKVTLGRFAAVLADLRPLLDANDKKLRWNHPTLEAAQNDPATAKKLAEAFKDLKPPASGDVLLVLDKDMRWPQLAGVFIALAGRKVTRISIAVTPAGEGQAGFGGVPLHLPTGQLEIPEEEPVEEVR